MSHAPSEETQNRRRSRRAWVQVALLLVAVPMGITSAWLLQAPSMDELGDKAAGGADTAALLKMVHRASLYPEAAEALSQLLLRDAGAMRALAGLAASHEDALLCFLSLAHYHPETLEYLRELEIDYSFALSLLERVPADAMETLAAYTEECPNACFMMGVAYENGCHVPQDWEQAAAWYGRAYDAGYELAASYYAPAAYQAGLAAEELAAAADWFLESAECGYAAAQCALGVCYAEVNDAASAVYWYTQAAEQGLSDAQYNLGWCYLHGEGVAQDAAEAVRWFLQAAEQGDDLAQYYVGRAYELGEGINRDYAEAVRWYRWAVEHENAAAQCALGHCYAQGLGVEQSWSQAVHYYQLSAAQNRSEAQLALAHCYERGLGVPQDANLARQWRDCAAITSQQQLNES